VGLRSWAKKLIIRKVVIPEAANQLDAAAASIGTKGSGEMKAKLLHWGEGALWFIAPVVVEEVSRQMNGGHLDLGAIGSISLITLAAYLRKQAAS
jgi:hypothetical protein